MATRRFAVFLIVCGALWSLAWTPRLIAAFAELGDGRGGTAVATSFVFVFSGAIPILFGFILRAIQHEQDNATKAPPSEDDA